MVDTTELRKAASAVYLATEESIADDLSKHLKDAAEEIDKLRKLASSIQCDEFTGLRANDIDNTNWFDYREEVTKCKQS